MIQTMPLPARFKAFFDDQAHRFAQCKYERNRGRVMIQAVLAPIIHGRGQIEIPALYFRFPLAEYFFGRGTHGDGRHPWRRADGLLRATEANVDALAVHMQRHCRKGCHGIDN